MNANVFILVFFGLCGGGILLSLVTPKSWQGTLFAWIGCLASLALLRASVMVFFGRGTLTRELWTIPELGTLSFHMDRLSALFTLVTGLVLFPASIFAGGELNALSQRRNVRTFTILCLGLYASIALIFIAGDVLFFLITWEIMSILCYLLVVFEHEQKGRADAGYLLLALGEAGALAALLGLLLLAVSAGSLDFAALKTAACHLGPGTRWTIFLLTFLGFGVKAGLVPVNFWLPRAYTAAPSAFVPILAGATLNLGLYGILRVNADLVPMTLVGPGLVALVVGTVSALLGILYATTENDLKTMLAHSSIENAGIIVVGFGAGIVFSASNHSALAAIAFAAALYHLINHSLYKTLLFCGAGAVESQTGTRDLDQLGGLIKHMPWTALFFLVGVLSIAALPPFNGFVSEWLTLQTMLRSVELSSTGVKMVFALCGAGLALTAALAVTCFVKTFAMGFLGMSRLENAEPVREARRTALVPMAILAALCLAFGVLPTYVIPALDEAVHPLTSEAAADVLVPPFFTANAAHQTLSPAFVTEFHNLGAQVGQRILPGRGLVVMHRGGETNPVVFAMSTSYLLVTFLILLGLTYVIFKLYLSRGRKMTRQPRWDGGLRRLLPEMTYTATGFSNPVRVIFDAVFRPSTVEDTSATVAEHFRTAIHRERDRPHVIDRAVYQPIKSISLQLARALAAMHHGRLNAYIAYVLLTLLLVLLLALIL